MWLLQTKCQTVPIYSALQQGVSIYITWFWCLLQLWKFPQVSLSSVPWWHILVVDNAALWQSSFRPTQQQKARGLRRRSNVCCDITWTQKQRMQPWLCAAVRTQSVSAAIWNDMERMAYVLSHGLSCYVHLFRGLLFLMVLWGGESNSSFTLTESGKLSL